MSSPDLYVKVDLLIISGSLFSRKSIETLAQASFIIFLIMILVLTFIINTFKYVKFIV